MKLNKPLKITITLDHGYNEQVLDKSVQSIKEFFNDKNYDPDTNRICISLGSITPVNIGDDPILIENFDGFQYVIEQDY